VPRAFAAAADYPVSDNLCGRYPRRGSSQDRGWRLPVWRLLLWQPRANQFDAGGRRILIGTLLQKQLEAYERQVNNKQLSPSTLDGYRKAIHSERMKVWTDQPLSAATPSALRKWIGDIGITAKFTGNFIWSDLATYQTYLRRFADSYKDAVETMRTHLAIGDRPGGAALAHKLSGVAANLALPDTRLAAQEAERVLATQDDAESALADLSRALTVVLAEIDRYAPPIELVNEATGTAEGAARALSEAEQLALKKQLAPMVKEDK
jgi:HPt (histidine-containing phosphotransfer) domain-containing protein